jgi:hypothetical protein
LSALGGEAKKHTNITIKRPFAPSFPFARHPHKESFHMGFSTMLVRTGAECLSDRSEMPCPSSKRQGSISRDRRGSQELARSSIPTPSRNLLNRSDTPRDVKFLASRMRMTINPLYTDFSRTWPVAPVRLHREQRIFLARVSPSPLVGRGVGRLRERFKIPCPSPRKRQRAAKIDLVQTTWGYF